MGLDSWLIIYRGWYISTQRSFHVFVKPLLAIISYNGVPLDSGHLSLPQVHGLSISVDTTKIKINVDIYYGDN